MYEHRTLEHSQQRQQPPPPPHPSSHAHPPGPSGPPPPGPGVAAYGGPAAGGLRLEELLMTIRAEYEGLAINMLDQRRGGDEFEGIVKQHLHELSAMRSISYDLQRKHEADKRILTDDLRRLQEENARLHHQLKARAIDGTRQEGPTPTSAPQGARPVLPSLSSQMSDAGGPGGGPSWSDGKLRRSDEDERGAKFKGPTLNKPLSRPSSTQPGSLPSSAALHNSVSRSSTGRASPALQSERAGPQEDAPFDPATATSSELRKEGSDWLTVYNPSVKRVLDVGLVHTLVHDSVVCCVRFSPDGKTLATGCNRSTTLYDTKTGAKSGVLVDETANPAADNYIRVAMFSPDGKLLATGSEDRIIRIWNLAQKRIWKVFQGHKSEIYSLAFSPDGRKLVSGSGDKTARMWDMDTGACLYTLNVEESPSAAGPDGASVDAGVTSVVLSPDGRFLAASSLDTFVRVWNAANGQLLDTLKGHKDSVYSVVFTPDGRSLVSGSLDKTLKTWDIDALRFAFDREQSTQGKAANLATFSGHKDYVLSVDVSPDGQWIMSGSKDRGIQFWDPKTGKAQFMLQGHKNSVINVAVASTGNMFATASGDWSARIWSFERI